MYGDNNKKVVASLLYTYYIPYSVLVHMMVFTHRLLFCTNIAHIMRSHMDVIFRNKPHRISLLFLRNLRLMYIL